MRTTAGPLRPTVAAAATGVVLGMLAAAFDDARLPSAPVPAAKAKVSQHAPPRR